MKNANQQLIDAAKNVVALSGWTEIPTTAPNEQPRRIFQSSYMAVAVLKDAIQETENPQLRLAPEPLPVGL